MANRNRVVWIDIAKGLAIVMVVTVHASCTFLYKKPPPIPLISWWTLNVLNTVSRVSVPLFFMLSGAISLGNPANISLNDAYVRRLVRIAMPLVAWSVVYMLLGRSPNSSNKTIDILRVLNGPVYYHLWFLYAIFGIFLLLPFVNAIACTTGEKGALAFGTLWMAIVAIQWTAEYFVRLKVDPNFVKVLPAYLGYFLLGWSLCSIRVSRVIRIAFAVVAILGNALCAISTWYLNVGASQFNGHAGDYLNPLVMVVAVSTFLLLTPGATPTSGARRCIVSTVLSALGQRSSGIYLSHVLILEYTLRIAYTNNHLCFRPLSHAIVVPLITILVVVISWAFTAIANRIPILRHFV